jgi:serine/threonine protein kinase
MNIKKSRKLTPSVCNTATIIPVAVLVFCLLCLLILVLMGIIRLKGRGRRDDWEIAYDELEIGEHLGSGGYGEVHKAVWKGTEVAVKVMTSQLDQGGVTKDMEKSFKDEVRVMTALRHPNVVLFMAACTKPPRMCIVMEFMALGSLYDVRSLSPSESFVVFALFYL